MRIIHEEAPVKDNKDILNEAFFKKASYAEKQSKKMAQYVPVDANKASGYTSNAVPLPAYQVTDTDEVKKRLAGAFGVTFGNNNVRNMASRAIKEFPIIISDNIEPETAVMLKKLLEEQYAEYINLLISNQVVNLADYRANDQDGNIAIQALDTISGTDFKKSRIANTAARTGELNTDTIFANIPLYNLLRENQKVLLTGDSLTDALLEDACVMPNDQVDTFVEFLKNNANEIAVLKEEDEKVNRELNLKLYKELKASKEDNEKTKKEFEDRIKALEIERDVFKNQKDELLKQREDFEATTRDNMAKTFKLNSLINSRKLDNNALQDLKAQDMKDIARGYRGLDSEGKEIYDKITTADIVLDRKRFDAAVNRSVGESLILPENKDILENMQYATFLLQSRMISGIEYYQYLTMRLGIPVSDAARRELVSRFKIAEIRKYGQGKDVEDDNPFTLINNDEIAAIASNRASVEKIIRRIGKVKIKDVIAPVGAGAAGIGAGISILTLLSNPFGWAIIAGSAIGSISYLLYKLKASKKQIEVTDKIEGWERVEYLIKKLKQQRADIKTTDKTAVEGKFVNNTLNQIFDTSKPIDNKILNNIGTPYKSLEQHKADFEKTLKDSNDRFIKLLRESVEVEEPVSFINMRIDEKLTEEFCLNLIDTISECMKEPHLKAQYLTEKTLGTTSMPMTVKYVAKKDDKDLLFTPSFMARDSYAYGSTEIERKDNKDRRYNQPLIMTVKFKERYSDGKYTDNELTAVIGILGRIIRVPSSEMEYILKENIDGNTIEGIFKGNIKDTVADLLSTSKISKDMKNLPQSADIWHNLEKVATLAAANKISGKRSGNVANAHIIFSQKEVDAVRNETGVDYIKDSKKAVALMKRYSAFTVMIASDAGQRVYIMDDQDNISWNVVPYSALTGKDSGDQLNAALTKMMRL